MIKITDIPKKYSSIYSDRIDKYLWLFNPESTKGVIILNKETAYVYSKVDNHKTVVEIYETIKQTYPEAKLPEIIHILQQLINNQVLFIKTKPQGNLVLLSKKPKHLGVWLHVTNQCNLRCKYCYVNKSAVNMTLETGYKAINKIINSAHKNNFPQITIKFSGGECLLRLSFVLKLVEYGRKQIAGKDIKMDFVVLTNGVLLTEKIAKILKKEHIRASVSLDGLNKYNDSQRVFANGLGSFSYVEKGINNLIKEKVKFNISVTITANNVSNIPQLTKYLLNKNIPFVFNFFRENSNVQEKLESNDKKIIFYLKKAYSIIAKNPPPYSLLNGLLDRVSFVRPHLNTCGMGKNYLVVNHDGSLASCQMTLYKPIGSIDDKNLIHTMKKGSFIKPKGLTVEGKKPCNNCQWKYVCCGGCPLLTFEQKGKYNINSPYCNVYKALIPEALKVEAMRLIKYSKN
jgi:uncharacterized protein